MCWKVVGEMNKIGMIKRESSRWLNKVRVIEYFVFFEKGND